MDPAATKYSQARLILIDYLRMKVTLEDWHGVSDAANDLRELDAKEAGRRENGSQP